MQAIFCHVNCSQFYLRPKVGWAQEFEDAFEIKQKHTNMCIFNPNRREINQ